VDKEKRRLLRGYQQLVATLLLSLADALMDAADDCCEQELDLAKIGRILPSSLEWVDGKESMVMLKVEYRTKEAGSNAAAN